VREMWVVRSCEDAVGEWWRSSELYRHLEELFVYGG